MNRSERRAPFVVGEWTVLPSRLRLERDESEAVEIEPKVMEVLLHLAARPGDVHTRRELLDTVWPGVVVGDEALTRAIYELRKALGDRSRAPRYVETIPKVGYRLMAEVREIETGGPTPEAPATTRPRATGPVAASLLPLLLVVAIGLLAWLLDSPESGAEPSTSPILNVTSDPGIERTPAASPDGRRIAYAGMGVDDGGTRIWVRSFERGHPLRITEGPGTDHSPAWSPDGDRIAFLRSDGGRCSLRVIPSLGGPDSTLAECEGASFNSLYHHLSWSPDGRWIAFSDGPANTDGARIRLVEVSTGEVRELPLEEAGDGGAALIPTFSPSGDRIAYARYVEGASELVVRNVRDGRLTGPDRVVAENLNNVDGIAWSPDGAGLVFSSDRSGSFALYEAGLDDRALRPVGVGQDVRRPAAVPGRDLVLYESWRFDFDVWGFQGPAATLDRSPPGGPLVDSTRCDAQPTVSPDGRRVAFISNRTGRYEVWTVDSNGGDQTAITELEAQGMVGPRWSPDGSRLVVGAQVGIGQDPGADLWIVDAPGRSARRLTDWQGHEFVGDWSPEGLWIYFGSRRSGDWEIWRIPVGGGTPERITDDGGYVARIEGERLYYTKHQRDGLWSRPLDGGPEIRITSSFPSWDLFWNVRDGAAWRISGSPSPHLARLDLRSGIWERARDLPDGVAAGFDLGPGLDRIWLSLDAGSTSDLRAARAF